jgi:hypothetical protein
MINRRIRPDVWLSAIGSVQQKTARNQPRQREPSMNAPVVAPACRSR